MTAAYALPEFVQKRMQRRAASDAAIGHGQCIYGCRAEAHLYPGGTFCDEHSPWHLAGLAKPGATAYPEHLRQRRALGQYRTASMPTISDHRAEASGKRDPNRAARRNGTLGRDTGTAAAARAADPSWRHHVDQVIAQLAHTGQPFTADDVRDLGVPDPDSPKAWGAAFLAASNAGLIRRIGSQQSRRPSVHSHHIAIWQGAAA